ncbi:diacylglycerol kinase accessory domain protein [Oesophagostomum dentatum]|uniref:Diacylglycerol kinase n=1 Tax=Oesophagostomum dentatum TaxID=61180 RepID=A0A0B1TVD9_OESDE|nr:diacylglycerol kinase accessory domain protein [Oesophagostomum dentatum]
MSCSISGHYWTRVDFVDRGFFCASCKNHLVSGYECDFCTLKVDEVACARTIGQKITCKGVQKPDDEGRYQHHWIPGNIDSDQFCFICDELCGGGVSLRDYSCCLCWRVIHSACMKKNVSEYCDFGPYRFFTFPPDNVYTRRAGKRMVIEQVTLPGQEGFKPIVALINTVCGSCTGKIVYRSFLRHLHPKQVIDVQKDNLKSALQWIDDNPKVDVRLVVAGGDGTISNVLETLEEFQRKPPMAVLPLGTGNDLSRVLGWGSGTNGDLDILQYLNDVYAADLQKLDRWKIMIKSKNQFGRRTVIKNMKMSNYVSIGVDASVTLGMQQTRRSIPRAWSSRFLNKFLFFSFGTKDVFTRTCKGLSDKISLYLDDQLVELPDIEGIVFLNIQCWGAGVQPWKNAEEERPQRLDDGVFEVFAVTSSFHIAQLQVGLSSPVFIGQARKAVVVTKNGSVLPMQCDGEAWMQSRCEFHLSHHGESHMLRKLESPTQKTFF